MSRCSVTDKVHSNYEIIVTDKVHCNDEIIGAGAL